MHGLPNCITEFHVLQLLVELFEAVDEVCRDLIAADQICGLSNIDYSLLPVANMGGRFGETVAYYKRVVNT